MRKIYTPSLSEKQRLKAYKALKIIRIGTKVLRGTDPEKSNEESLSISHLNLHAPPSDGKKRGGKMEQRKQIEQKKVIE